ncbi:MAG TPA: hypothetical protein VML19_16090 [Verrucomicrobiae bacterium]|nr:hypothetical protein [Verrucomicrobiae bacterium]
MPTTLNRLTCTPAFDGQSTRDSQIHTFLERQWRLPNFAKRWKYHRSYMDAAGTGMSYALNWLATQVSIVDPVVTHELPPYLQSLVKGLIHIYRTPKAGLLQQAWNAAANILDDDRAASFVNQHGINGASRKIAYADWFRLAMYEPSTQDIKIKKYGIAGVSENRAARWVRFAAEVPYELVLFVGKGDPLDAPDRLTDENMLSRALVNSGGTVPLSRLEWDHGWNNHRWFKVGHYVPHQAAKMMMEPVTRDHYLRITGFSTGQYNPDNDVYWRIRGEERALEVAKIPYLALKRALKPWVIAQAVLAGTGISLAPDAYRPTERPMNYDERMRKAGAGDSDAGFITYATTAWNGYTDKFNRKSIVPPGYCFVKFNTLLYLRVVAVNHIRMGDARNHIRVGDAMNHLGVLAANRRPVGAGNAPPVVDLKPAPGRAIPMKPAPRVVEVGPKPARAIPVGPARS